MIGWEACRKDFEPDGAVRDIYVLATTVDDWNKLFGVLCETFTLEYSVNGDSRPFPLLTNQVLVFSDADFQSVNFKIADVVITCNFFGSTEIEFFFWPEDVTSEVVFQEILRFIKLVGDTIGKMVLLCYENTVESQFITYEPYTHEFKYREHPALPDDVA